MTLDLSKIKTLNGVDFENYEIRGAKPSVNNARTTGPLYVSGTYEPDRNDLSGDASFVSDSSIVTDISFNSPYSSFDASVFKPNDYFYVNSDQFLISSVKSPTSVELNENSGYDSTQSFTTLLGNRDYLVEPDKFNNTLGSGTATFTKNSKTVVATSPWPSDLTSNDFIKRNDYQVYYRISSIDSTELELANTFSGPTGLGSYTAKKQRIGQMYVRYTKDDFSYQKNGAYWKVDETTSSKILTSASFSPLADGIDLKFTPTISADVPDLMDTNTVEEKVLVKESNREIFQFSLPAIPNPEDTLKLYINDEEVDRFPSGNQDYVINYHSDPIYLPPPPLEERKVANIMFLDGVSDVDLNTEDTVTGVFNLTNNEGRTLQGIMPGSADIKVDGTDLERFRNYISDNDTGQIFAVNSHTNEKLVESVGVNIGKLVNYGIKVTLNGKELTYTIPPSDDDQVRIVHKNGRVVPSEKDHPAPGEKYLVQYYVEADQIANESVEVTAGMTSFRVKSYPIQMDSVILMKNNTILDENEDYRVSYQTGRIVLFTPLESKDNIKVTYIPLSLQQNGISYENDTSYCTVYDGRLDIVNASDFIFKLSNPVLDIDDIQLFEVFNQTRSRYYNINGVDLKDNTIQLVADSTNTSIGIDKNDVITADYKFENSGIEYAPINVTNLTFYADTTSLYLVDQNSVSYFPIGGVVKLTPSDAARDYYFTVTSATFDGEDTVVNFNSGPPEDIINPYIYASDASVSFMAVPAQASNIISGINEITFPSFNIPDIFKKGSILQISNDAYTVNGATYNDGTTTVTLQSDVSNDYTSSSILSSIRVSQTPFYTEGATTLTPSELIVNDPAQTALSFTAAYGNYTLSTDSSKLTIISDSSTHEFGYDLYPTISDLSGGIGSFIPSITVNNYVSDWTSSKITQTSSLAILPDTTSALSIEPALRLKETDTTDFEIENGLIILNNGLEPEQRYNLDYQGQNYLGDSSVNISARYFTALSGGSKISASFEYDNLDQFYIQVMSQREFLESVIEPRQEEEALQNLGNVGQGGEIAGDEDQGNAEGGLVDNEYRRKDAEIECRVYEQIYDFFSNRVQYFADELYAATGLRLLNNDGLLNETDQSMATRAFSRVFPVNYQEFEPYPIAALTGQAEEPGKAIFKNGQTGVDGIDTIWSQQLRAGDYIRPKDMTTDYEIKSISSDTSVSLTETFMGSSSSASGEKFVLTAGLPIFDDDGFLGAKVVGNKSENFELNVGDRFDATIDGQDFTSTFTDPFVYYWNGSEVARKVSSDIPQINMTYEKIYDPDTPYGIKSALVIRTDGTNNCIKLDGTVSQKLGFIPDSTSPLDYELVCGNRDRTDSSSECIWDLDEIRIISQMRTPFIDIINDGTNFKLDRTDSTTIGYAYDIQNFASQQLADMSREQKRLNQEIAALNLILEEPSLPSYNSALIAYGDATQFRSDTSDAMTYVGSLLNWQDASDATSWVLSFDSTRQYIRGINSTTHIGVDVSTGSGIDPITGRTEFILQAMPNYDTRILNMPPDRTPVIRYEDNDQLVDGSWTGWDTSFPVSGRYSLTNQITFHSAYSEAFYLSPDSVTINPRYSTDSSNITIDWTKAEGFQSFTYPYSSYPTLQSLRDAIDTSEGWGAYLQTDDTGYDYTNLTVASNVSVSGPPGTDVYLGVNSPVFDFIYHPVYSVTGSSLIVNDTTMSFGSYPSLGSLSDFINSLNDFTMSGLYASDYTYSSFQTASGDVSTGLPGTRIFFNSDIIALGIKSENSGAYYITDSSAITIYWDSSSKSFNYTSYSTLIELSNAISDETGIDSYVIPNAPSYEYKNLKELSWSISDSSYSPIWLGTGSPALEFYFTGRPTYTDDATAFTFDMYDGHKEFLYSSYPSLGSLYSGVDSIAGIDLNRLMNDTDLNYGGLKNDSGSIPMSDSTGDDRGRIISVNHELFSMANDSTLGVKVDGGSDQTVTFKQVIYLNPGDNFQNIIDNTGIPGTLYIIKSGLHREQRVVPNDRDMFIGEPDATMNGARLISGWVADSSYWKHTLSEPLIPGERNGECTDATSVEGSIKLGLGCIYPEDLYVFDSSNGTQRILERVGKYSDLTTGTGTWYFDYTNIYTYDNWTSAQYTVELGTTQFAFGYNLQSDKTGLYLPDHTYGTPLPDNTLEAPDLYDPLEYYYYKPKWITINNLCVEKYANPAQTGAIGYHRPGIDWTVEDCEIKWNHGYGVKWRGKAHIKGNKIHHNIQAGFGCGDGNSSQANGGDLSEWGWYGGYAGYGALFEENEIYDNFSTVRKLNDDWEGGTCKLSQCFDMTCSNNYIHDNTGRGIWFDFAYKGNFVTNNSIENNKKEGILIEITDGSNYINYNDIKNNASNTTTATWDGGQITISNSPGNEIDHNYLVLNASYGNGITIGDFSWRNVEGNNIYSYNTYAHHNHITHLGSGGSFGVNLGQTNRSKSTFFNTSINTFDNNIYHVINTSNQYWRWDQAPFSTYPPFLTWAQWQAHGQDPSGSIDTSTGYDPGYSGYTPHVPGTYIYRPELRDISGVSTIEVVNLLNDSNYGLTGATSDNLSGFVRVSSNTSGGTIQITGGNANDALNFPTNIASAYGTAPVNPVTMYFDTVSHPVSAMKIFWEMNNRRYEVDSTSMWLRWDEDSTMNQNQYPFSTYTTIGSLKTGLDQLTGVDVTGSSIYDSSSPDLIVGSGSISPDATIYANFSSPLRNLYVDYQTISDEYLSDGTNNLSDRSDVLTDRLNFLLYDTTNREGLIRQSFINDELFRSIDGSYGNLYVWADNRFNRSGGCEAKLKQVEKLIQMAQTNLQINRRFL